jgi:cupin fold WbuC family metalloprotein
MEYIKSKLSSDKILHIINRKSEIIDRTNVIPDSNFLQLATLHMKKGQTFKPHKHIWKSPTFEKYIAQESWVVINGSVRCYFYDTDDTLIETVVLMPGDCSITLEGGHTYEILENDTIVYEYKTGPYYGQELDKEFI